ncbi:MAG: methionine gamma-lyase [Bacteroidia bacterium]
MQESHFTESAATQGFSTRSVHAGQYEDPVNGAVGTPIFQTTSFRFTPEAYTAIMEGEARDRFVYTRYNNPTLQAVAAKVAQLEGAASGLVFSSGMGAISTVLEALLSTGDHLVTSLDVYGGTYRLLRTELPRFGIGCSYVDPRDLAAVEAAITPQTRVLYFETLSNPLLKLAPVAELAAIARAHGCLLVIDNTFLSPYNYRPLADGADIVVHSASKYLNGHSDLIAGAAAGSRELMDQVWWRMIVQGTSMDPHAAFLLERGMKSLALRMEAHNRNAADVAQWLDRHPAVKRVNYAGLPQHPQHDLARQMCPQGLGGMVTFEMQGGNAAGLCLMQHLRIASEATSLGGVESLISMPFNSSHAGFSPEDQAWVGLQPGTVRLSVGIEDVADLIADLAQALDLCEGVSGS